MERINREPSPSAHGKEENRDEKMATLRKQIQRAEAEENEATVLRLEAELKALESGVYVDAAAYTAQKAPIRKTEVLRTMQDIRGTHDDRWSFDGIYLEEDDRNYDAHFSELMEKLGYKTFQELVRARSIALRRPVSALDLFGGAYFLQDLSDVSHIAGVRLRNTDEDFADPDVVALRNDPRRSVIEANLYESKSWKAIQKDCEENTFNGFDLIVCRPQGPFGVTPGHFVETIRNVRQDNETLHKQEIFVALLERTLDLLSPDNGTLFLQLPVLYTREDIEEEFWKQYQEKKTEYEFTFGTYSIRMGNNVTVQRKTPSEGTGEV